MHQILHLEKPVSPANEGENLPPAMDVIILTKLRGKLTFFIECDLCTSCINPLMILINGKERKDHFWIPTPKCYK
jgi:hypothetical protein